MNITLLRFVVAIALLITFNHGSSIFGAALDPLDLPCADGVTPSQQEEGLYSTLIKLNADPHTAHSDVNAPLPILIHNRQLLLQAVTQADGLGQATLANRLALTLMWQAIDNARQHKGVHPQDVSDVESAIAYVHNINAVPKGNMNPLGGAVVGNLLDITRILLAHNADPNLPTESESLYPALHVAVISNHPSMVDLLLQCTDIQISLTAQDKTALECACAFTPNPNATQAEIDIAASKNLAICDMLKKAHNNTNPGKFICSNARCLNPGKLRCSICKIARYCSVECQKQYQPKHKPDCVPSAQSATAKKSPAASIAPSVTRIVEASETTIKSAAEAHSMDSVYQSSQAVFARHYQNEKKFWNAIADHNSQAVATLIPHIVNLNMLREDGFTPLFYATKERSCYATSEELDSIVSLLLERQADPNIACGEFNSTPLHVAVEGSCLSIVTSLLADKRTNITLIDKQKKTPLDLALARNKQINATILLTGRTQDYIDQLNDNKAIIDALKAAHNRLNPGASYCAATECYNGGKSNCGRCNAIQYCSKACQANHWKCHKHHCGPSAAKKHATPPPSPNPLATPSNFQQDSPCEEELHNALIWSTIYDKNCPRLESIIPQFPNIQKMRDYNGFTPLGLVIQQNSKEMVRALLEHNIDPNLPVDSFDHPALHMATILNRLSLVKILLEDQKTDCNLKHQNKTALDLAHAFTIENLLKTSDMTEETLNNAIHDNREIIEALKRASIRQRLAETANTVYGSSSPKHSSSKQSDSESERKNDNTSNDMGKENAANNNDNSASASAYMQSIIAQQIQEKITRSATLCAALDLFDQVKHHPTKNSIDRLRELLQQNYALYGNDIKTHTPIYDEAYRTIFPEKKIVHTKARKAPAATTAAHAHTPAKPKHARDTSHHRDNRNGKGSKQQQIHHKTREQSRRQNAPLNSHNAHKSQTGSGSHADHDDQTPLQRVPRPLRFPAEEDISELRAQLNALLESQEGYSFLNSALLAPDASQQHDLAAGAAQALAQAIDAEPLLITLIDHPSLHLQLNTAHVQKYHLDTNQNREQQGLVIRIKTWPNGCYTAYLKDQENDPKSFFPSGWTLDYLTQRFQRAIMQRTTQAYRNDNGDICIIGSLPPLPGDRGSLQVLQTVYGKAIIKARDLRKAQHNQIALIVQTLHPIAPIAYNQEQQKIASTRAHQAQAVIAQAIGTTHTNQ